MNLWDLYEKFNQIKVFLAGPGADAIEKAIEINEKITDVMRDVKDYLQSLDKQGGFKMASLSIEDTNAIEEIKKVKGELESIAGVREGQVGVKAIPGLKELLAVVVTEIIKRLLERWGS